MSETLSPTDHDAATSPRGPSAADSRADSATAGPSTTLWSALSGVLAAGAALATGEVLSGLSKTIPSLVVGIAEIFTAETPGAVVRWSIETFGTSQKTLLVWGITIGSLVAGAILGMASRKRKWIGVAGFAAFGVVGGWAAARAALSNNALSWLSAILAAGVGIAVLRLLVGRLPFSPLPSGANPITGTEDRRVFLGVAGGAAFWALFGTGLGRSLRLGHSVEGARERIAADIGASPGAPGAAADAAVAGSLDSIDGVSSVITPNDDFYLIDTAIRKPQIDPATWSMKITGMVDNELEFTFDDLLAMDQIEEFITLSCVSNEVGGNLVGNAVWTGVPLAALLDMAGVHEGATQIVGRSVDGWTGGFPTEIAFDGRPAMVALTMNGEPLPVRHGFPARLVVPGLYGYVLSLIHISEPTRPAPLSRMPSSA